MLFIVFCLQSKKKVKKGGFRKMLYDNGFVCCFVYYVKCAMLHLSIVARQENLSRGSKELLGSSDIRLDGRLALLPSDGADLTVLLFASEMKEKKCVRK